jgi:hypothetical protein
MDHVFRDAGALAQVARWALCAEALVSAAAVALALTLGADALVFGEIARPLALIQLVTGLGSLILFLIWFYRANANVRAMGADGLMGSPGLSVAWFFIPIAFLFMPYAVVRDTWKASAAPRDWQGQPTEPLIFFWWAAMLIAYITGAVSWRIAMEGDYEIMAALGVLDLVSNAMAAAAALLGALVVTRIQGLQVSPAHLSERFR